MNIDEFNRKIENNNSALLIGNGFSINFDGNFGNIFDRLYSAHKDVIYKSKYHVKSNKRFRKKCYDNFESIKQYLRNISEEDLNQLFEDALIFAESIKNNNRLVAKMWEEKLINQLTFGLSQIDIVKQICKIGRMKGIEHVNIEHWTILIYFYFAINHLSCTCYKFPSNNSFIIAVKMGNRSRISLTNEENQVIENTILNGFTTYYRILFSTAIFANGKAINIATLNNINNLNIDSIKSLLEKFNLLISLNFDHIIDSLVSREVEHLHGKFVYNKKEYVFAQSLGMRYSDGYVSFSDILMGDYFVFKSMLPIISKSSQQGNHFNKRIPHFSQRTDEIIYENNISTVVIFGMNIENDQHVLRNLILAFYNLKQNNPQIIYCYFNEQEKEDFSNEFNAVLTFSDEVNEYANKIEVSYIRSQEILERYFV